MSYSANPLAKRRTTSFGAAQGVYPCPDRRRIGAPGGPGSRGAERSRSLRSDAAGALEAGWRVPMMGGAGMGGEGMARAGRRRPRGVGVACRGGVVAVATATLICAGRDRRSVIRRMVPLTNYEGRGCVHSARGGRSCGGERPGRPPARGGQLVISAQTKPASSRAIAVTATPAGLPRAVIVL